MVQSQVFQVGGEVAFVSSQSVRGSGQTDAALVDFSRSRPPVCGSLAPVFRVFLRGFECWL